MDADVNIRYGDVRLQVRGLRKFLRQAEQAGADTADMRALMHDMGMIVVRHARTTVPVTSGKLRRTIRAGRAKTKAVVRAGSKAVPYGGVIHYGSPAEGKDGSLDKNGRFMNIPKNHFMIKSLRATAPAVFDRLETGILEILRKNDLI